MEKKIKVLVIITDGTEDIEAVVPIDLFRRAGFEVLVAGEKEQVIFARGLKVVPDQLLDNIQDVEDFDLILIPGGAKGVENLLMNERVGELIRKQREKAKWNAAICAGPLVLEKYGVFSKEEKITSHPSVKDKLSEYNYLEDDVVVSGKIITSRGAGTSITFTLKIIELLAGKEMAKKIANDIVYKID